MMKKILFAVAPMMLIAGSVTADDDILSTIANLDGGTTASQPEDADTFGQADVDALLGEDNENGEEAIAACFRRIGYGNHYGSYGGYRSYRGYSSYRSWYNPVSYCHYTPVRYTYFAPAYSCYTPCYTSYWGCY